MFQGAGDDPQGVVECGVELVDANTASLYNMGEVYSAVRHTRAGRRLTGVLLKVNQAVDIRDRFMDSTLASNDSRHSSYINRCSVSPQGMYM